MASSVVLPFPVSGNIKEEEKPSKTYRLDLDKGRIYGFIDETEAVEQAIRKALITPRFKCLIYDHDYGSEIQQAILMDDKSHSYVKAAIEGFVRDALMLEERITNIKNFKAEIENDEVFVSFTVSSIFGEFEFSEVV